MINISHPATWKILTFLVFILFSNCFFSQSPNFFFYNCNNHLNLMDYGLSKFHLINFTKFTFIIIMNIFALYHSCFLNQFNNCHFLDLIFKSISSSSSTSHFFFTIMSFLICHLRVLIQSFALFASSRFNSGSVSPGRREVREEDREGD